MKQSLLLLIGLTVVLSSGVAYAATVAELGGCMPSSSGFASEEARARHEAEKAKLKTADILARLIYSEALSSGYWRGVCKAKSEADLFETIGWGIMNRVQKAGPDAYYGVVFAKNQFRTSFSPARRSIAGFEGKVVNPFAIAFLCPLRAKDYLSRTSNKPSAEALYTNARDIAGKIIRTYSEDGIPTPYRGITNFFYPHSEFFGEMRPPWAKNSDPVKNKGYLNLLDVTNPCVEFYRL